MSQLTILRRSLSSSKTTRPSTDLLSDIFDLCKRILLDGSSERMISVGKGLIENIVYSFSQEPDIVTVLDSLMETLLENELYANKRSLNKSEESIDAAFWSKYFKGHKSNLSTKQVGMIMKIKSV